MQQLSPMKRFRLERGLKQEDLERLTGIPQPRLSRLERWMQNPTEDERKRIAKAFDMAEDG